MEAPTPDLGLRRRSPNPNSPYLAPQPYSPALLSSYTNQLLSPRPLPQTPQHNHGSAPTIRLVPSSSSGSNAPMDTRHKSNDLHDRPSTIFSVVSTLRRHGTDPKTYPSIQRSKADLSNAYMFSGDPRERPVPPLPLNIRKPSSSTFRSETPMDKKEDNQAPHPSETPSSRSWRNFRNPFRKSYSAQASPASTSLSSLPELPASAPYMSRKMSRTSNSSTSTTSTVPVPFYPSTFYKAFGSSATTLAQKAGILQRVQSSEAGEKITAKVPEVKGKGAEEWTWFKVVLLISVLTLFGYGVAALCWAMQILLRIKPHSEVIMVSDHDIVIFLLLFSLLALFTSLVGLTGTLLSSRPILAFYNLLLWPTLLSLCLVGYTSYKRGHLQLDKKLNQAWSQYLNDGERLRVQRSLHCCGYFNPLHDAIYSKRCYPRTSLPGCKGPWTRFELHSLHDFATAAFSTVPFHLINIAIAILCSNHVDRTFGKGLTPLHYRLRMTDVRANALAVLASLPPPSQDSSYKLKRKPAMYNHGSRPSSRSSRERHSYSYPHPYPYSGQGLRHSSSHDSLDLQSHMYENDHEYRRSRPHPPSRRGSTYSVDSNDTLSAFPLSYRQRENETGSGRYRPDKGYDEVLREAGPRGRALREARERGMF